MKWLIPAALTIAIAVWLARRNSDAQSVGTGFEWDFTATEPDAFDQSPTLLEEVAVTLNPMNHIPALVSESTAARNERAFLDMIAYAEGTNGPHGYATAFGGGRIESLADHPRVYHPFTNQRGEKLKTSAAGRYQFLARTWDELARKLDLPDFGPASQDAAALELIRQRGALNDVRAGRTEAAIAKCAPTWASLPGAGYAQPERKLSTLLAQYRAAGGNMEA
jgi:muramidase (phage lysozyme)